MSYMIDREEWISRRTFEIGEQEYKADFSDLPEDLALKVFVQAEEDYVNMQVSRAETICGYVVERQMREG